MTSERIAYGDMDALIAVSNAVSRVPNPHIDAPISVYRDGILRGGVVYSDYTRESVCVHVAGFVPGWLSRTFLFIAFDYPFSQMGVKRVFSQIREDNLQSLGFNKKLGFEPVAYIPGVFPDNVAMIVTKLEREDCRWLDLATHYRREHTDG